MQSQHGVQLGPSLADCTVDDNVETASSLSPEPDSRCIMWSMIRILISQEKNSRFTCRDKLNGMGHVGDQVSVCLRTRFAFISKVKHNIIDVYNIPLYGKNSICHLLKQSVKNVHLEGHCKG